MAAPPAQGPPQRRPVRRPDRRAGFPRHDLESARHPLAGRIRPRRRLPRARRPPAGVARVHHPRRLPLGSWIRTQRKQYHAGRLDPDRAAALEALGIEWSPYEAMWQRGITAATNYHASHGHLQVPDNHVEADGYRLGQFIVAQRMLYKRGTLAPDRIAALEALGIIWNSREHRFNLGLSAAARYFQTHGDLIVPTEYRTPDGYPLSAWLKNQRAKLRASKLADHRIRARSTTSARPGATASNSAHLAPRCCPPGGLTPRGTGQADGVGRGRLAEATVGFSKAHQIDERRDHPPRPALRQTRGFAR
ncbi:helicase associated domain-containing protein [Plantactinospora sp. WMMB334]|uniref:helicase associated domain-containing protein n=1 Tax=Plantactinospora sp. WMMB334 TaxID=3404119 RepID=UPI003B924D74